MLESFEKAYNTARSFCRSHGDTLVASAVVLGLVGTFIKARVDPEFERMIFEPGGGAPLLADFRQTGGVDLELIPHTNTFVVRLRESARVATLDTNPEELVRRKVMSETGCVTSEPYQANPYANSSLALPGQDRSPVFVVTVSCRSPRP